MIYLCIMFMVCVLTHRGQEVAGKSSACSLAKPSKGYFPLAGKMAE